MKTSNFSSIKTAIRLLKTPHALLEPIIARGYLNWLPDRYFISLRYLGMTGKKLNLKKPRGFNEKLQYMKLYDRNPEYTKYVDKYSVREYVAEKIGSEYLVPLYDKWDSADEIDFTNLPSKFVLKCNHDSGSVKIITDKKSVNLDSLKAYYANRLKRSSFSYGREWPYKNVKPCIVAEAYLGDGISDLKDYKFFCFDGCVRFFKVDFDRFRKHRANYFDTDLNVLPVYEQLVPNDLNVNIDLPKEITQMMLLASDLSKGLTFVRVDFYNYNGKIYFGEMTFFPGSGFDLLLPTEWEEKVGEMLKLKNMKRE